MKIIYGMTVCNPEMATKIVMERGTWMDSLRGFLFEIAYIATQSLLLAGAITAFKVAFS